MDYSPYRFIVRWIIFCVRITRSFDLCTARFESRTADDLISFFLHKESLNLSFLASTLETIENKFLKEKSGRRTYGYMKKLFTQTIALFAEYTRIKRFYGKTLIANRTTFNYYWKLFRIVSFNLFTNIRVVSSFFFLNYLYNDFEELWT